MYRLSCTQKVRKSATAPLVTSSTRNAPPPRVPEDPSKCTQSPTAIDAAYERSAVNTIAPQMTVRTHLRSISSMKQQGHCRLLTSTVARNFTAAREEMPRSDDFLSAMGRGVEASRDAAVPGGLNH